jgi:hypothetical protein
MFRSGPTGGGQEATYISDQDRDSLLWSLSKRGLNFVSDLGWALDTPAAYVRSGIDYAQDGQWNDPLTDDRVSGRDLLTNAGLSTGNGYVDFWGGLATEVATDPLSLLTGPMSALTKSGRALKSAGLLDDAARYASRSLSDDASRALASGAPLDLPSYAKRTLSDMGADVSTDQAALEAAAKYAEHYGRPLVGARDSLRNSRLGDVIGSDPAMLEKVRGALDLPRGAAIPNDLLDDTLGRNFGLAMPLSSTNFGAFDVPGGAALGDAMDRAGSYLRWNPVGRGYAALTDKSVSGQTDALSQAIAKKANAYGDIGEAKAGREFVDRIGFDATMSPTNLHTTEIGEAMGRLMEDTPAARIATSADRTLMGNAPAVKKAVDEWGNIRQEILADGKRLGVPSAELEHPYGVGYLPYKENIPGYNEGGSRRVFDPETGDMLHRADYNKLPGGLAQLQELSADARFAGKGRTLSGVGADGVGLATDDEVAQQIYGIVNGAVPAGAPEYSMDNALGLTRMLNRLDGPKAIFGTHPLESVAQYMQGRGRKHGMVDALLDSVQGQVRDMPYTHVPGGGHISVGEALTTRLGLEPGAMDELAKRMGVTTDELANQSVSRDVIDNISRMADAYKSPQAQSTIAKYIKSYNNLFKANALLSGSRLTRDLYSSAIGNFILAGNSTLPGMADASTLMHGVKDNYRAFASRLADIPRYKKLPEADRLKAFMLDIGESRVLQGMGTLGTEIGDRTGEAVKTLMPGSVQENIYNPASQWSDLLSIRGVYDPATKAWGQDALKTRNPLYRAAEVAGDKSDTFTRLTGYMGLLRQNIDPLEAARLVKRQHVDYSQLTTVEKSLRDYLVPFYTYESRSIGRTVDDLVRRPGGRTGQMIRMLARSSDPSEQGDPYLPEHIRRLPPYIPLGDNNFLTNIEFPGINAINAGKIKKDANGWVDPYESLIATLQGYGSKLAPIPKASIELLSGNDLFSGKRINEVPTTLDRLIQSATGDDEAQAPDAINMASRFVAPALPLGLGKIVTQMTDTRSGASPEERAARAFLSATTGLQVKTATPEDAARDAQRQARELLKGHTRSYDSVSIAEDELLTLSPELRQVYELNRRLGKDSREAKKRREQLGLMGR